MFNNILKNIPIENEKYLIIGVSAGPDSMALLHYLITNTDKRIVVAHINHNVRKESNEEELYLKKYCKINNIIFESMKIDNYIENNFENEARNKRYNFYEQILNKYNSHYLFLAHHGDDLIETILMKICRGSNLEGYAGIKRISKIKNYYIVRPFLEYTKKDILKYDKDNNIKYYIDKSNEDITYTRNRFRKKILPLLKEEDKNIHKKFLKYSNTLLEYNDYINYETNIYMKKYYKNNTLDLKITKDIHPFLLKNIIYKILNQTYNNKPNIIKDKNIKEILSLINNNKPNISINLPNNIKLIKEYNKIYITNNNNNNNANKYKIEFKDYIKIDNHIIKKINNTEDNGNNICRLNTKSIKLPLYIRNKKDGDKIELLGLKGNKKVKDIFIDKKIPIQKRNRYPILVDSNDTILWIPNIKKSKFNLKKEENYDIIIQYCDEEENYE